MAPAQRHTQLLDVTLGLIASQGYDRVTIDAIAKAAGVTRPVVYGLFENLDELLRALFEREEQRALGQLARVVPSEPGDVRPDALLEQAIRSFLHVVAGDPDTWLLILLPPESTPEPVRDRVRANRERVLAQIEPLVAWGLKARGGPTGLDTELAARSLLTFAEEAGRLVLADPGRFPPDRLARFVATALGAFGTK